jgi:hypothetical protein
MANTKRVQLRKGTEQEHASFTGALAEVTVDTDKSVIRVHDGLTAGGFEVSKARYTLITSPTTLKANTKYYTDTTGSEYSVTLPTLINTGDYISLVDAKSFWNINNLIVVTQNNQKFKNASGLIDAPLVCDVSGASVELIWEGTYWRVSA